MNIEKHLNKENEALGLRKEIINNCMAIDNELEYNEKEIIKLCNYLDNDMTFNSFLEMFDEYCVNLIKAFKEGL